MLITRDISKYITLEHQPVRDALVKIDGNKKRIIFIVSEDGYLLGSLSDGDFRRWVTQQPQANLNTPVATMMNTAVQSNAIDTPNDILRSSFTERIDVIPLVDTQQKLIAIAIGNEYGIEIGHRKIDQDSPAFIIAEIGNNHNGDVNLARELVDLSVDAGADCVKFQMRHMDALYNRKDGNDDSADLGAQYVYDLLDRFQLTNDELLEMFDYCRQKGVIPMCTPWDLQSLEILEKYGLEAYKVASADFTNLQLLEALSNTGKVLFCSTGMSTESEIMHSANFLRRHASQFVLLHCNSTYPTPYKDIHLSYMERLKQLGSGIVGYSGHERGYHVPVAAVSLGAKVIEKHITIDKNMEGNDHKVSLLPDEFKQMVHAIRVVEESMGTGTERILTQGEMINRDVLAKSLICNRHINKGETITRDLIDIKSPGKGLQPIYMDELIGRQARRDMKTGDYFYESDLLDNIVEARDYIFNRPFGIPVRYHDYAALVQKSNFDFIEFHLSYNDMELDLEDYFREQQSLGFAVHSPELFANDHILNLASKDDSYWQDSINKLQRVVHITQALKEKFPATKRPVIVVNAGGFSQSGFLDTHAKASMYERVANALAQISQDGVEIIIQTMPPFPWHFGGQSYHNLFIDPNEILDFYNKYGYRICFDISHSMMACNYYGWKLTEFTQTVGPCIAYMHVVDALGIDGEGVQIGQGDVNFGQLAQDLSTLAPNAAFIPEVWQGHKNNGEGFWQALDFLEKQGL